MGLMSKGNDLIQKYMAASIGTLPNAYAYISPTLHQGLPRGPNAASSNTYRSNHNDYVFVDGIINKILRAHCTHIL